MKKLIGFLCFSCFLSFSISGQSTASDIEKEATQLLNFPYADFTNGGGFGKKTLVGIELFNDFTTENQDNVLSYNVKVGLSDDSYIGIGLYSFDGLLGAETIFVDYEFLLSKSDNFKLTGYVSLFTDEEFDSRLFLPGLKARFGKTSSNISIGYNPIVSFDDGFDIEFMLPFIINRNAGLHLNGFHSIANSQFSLFLNNTAVVRDGLQMYIISPGIAIDFKKVRFAPYLRNSIINFDGLGSNNETSLGISLYINP